jgi:hypothetical protein
VKAAPLELAKTACLVEYNSADYASYLTNVFAADPELQRFVTGWADDEIRHALLLKEWVQLADPRFDFPRSLQNFIRNYSLPLDARQSVRGSIARELVSRCVIASVAGAFFRSLAEETEEPVLREICEWIALDEERHFRGFHFFLRRHIDREKLSVGARLRVVLERCLEVEDEELATAYAAAHIRVLSGTKRRTRRHLARGGLKTAYRVYKYRHLQRAVSLIFTAAGLRPNLVASSVSSALVFGFLRTRSKLLIGARVPSSKLIGG